MPALSGLGTVVRAGQISKVRIHDCTRFADNVQRSFFIPHCGVIVETCCGSKAAGRSTHSAVCLVHSYVEQRPTSVAPIAVPDWNVLMKKAKAQDRNLRGLRHKHVYNFCKWNGKLAQHDRTGARPWLHKHGKVGKILSKLERGRNVGFPEYNRHCRVSRNSSIAT